MRIKGFWVQWIDFINLPWSISDNTPYLMSLPQHPIIKSAVFGEDVTQPTIKLTTGWLLGRIKRFDKRVHTPSSGWGHYLMTYEVISLFVSDWRNTEGGSLNHPEYLPWDFEGWRGWRGCPQSVVAQHVCEPLFQQLALGAYDLRVLLGSVPLAQ